MIDDIINSVAEGGEIRPAKDGATLYNESLITLDDGIERPHSSIAIEIDGELIEFVHEGAAMTVHGGDKAGKGVVNSIIITTWLAGSFGPFKADTGKRKIAAILHSDDTRYNLLSLGKKITRWSGSGQQLHENLRILSIRVQDILEKRLTLKELFEREDVGLLIIDLAWDWLGSVNDEPASKELTDYLIRHIDKHKCILVVTTHESRLSRQAKGHQGAHWTAKSETVLSVKKRKDKFIMTPEHCRGKQFGQVLFQYDGENITFLDASEWQKSRPSVIDFSKTDDNEHQKLLNQIFKEKPSWEPVELRTRLRVDFSKSVAAIGINLTKVLLKYYRDKGWLYTERKRYHFRHGLEHA